jgi:ribosomal protein S18 acetylase RimI-like enzyme
MAMEIVRLSAQEVAPVQDQIIEVYRQAFAGPPYYKDQKDVRALLAVFPRHQTHKEFRCVVARDSNTGLLAGFAYGYTGEEGQWWHDLVTRTMEPEMAREWMSDMFEVAEVAVLPAMQGYGYGGRIHDTLLTGLPHHTATLSTYQEKTTGLKMYEKRGWVTLLPNFVFPGYEEPYRIMGKHLRREG